MSKEFKGIWPAMFTPAKEDGTPAFDQLEQLVELFISQNLDGIYLLGSTGQGVLFTEEQRKKVTEVVSKKVADRLPVMVQVGALTTAESIRLARHAEQCGVDGISSVGPIYFPGPAEMALEHYKSIATATELPFFPYQLGSNSIPGNHLEFVEKLLQIPNVVGMKLTTNNLLEISSIHNYAGERLKLFSGSDELLCHASLCGTVGAIGSFYNLWGVPCKQIREAFINGNYHLTKEFMLTFQRYIELIVPHIWTFFRKAMQLKYNIDIGPAKAPLGNVQQGWKDEDVKTMDEKMENLVSSISN